MGSCSALKGHPASSQGDHLDQVHSDQMVLEMIRWGRGGWSSRAKLSGGPIVSKLRAKGLSGCHPSGQQLRQPDGGPEDQIRTTLRTIFLKETELKAALTGSTRRAKGSPPKKAQRLKKERCLL